MKTDEAWEELKDWLKDKPEYSDVSPGEILSKIEDLEVKYE